MLGQPVCGLAAFQCLAGFLGQMPRRGERVAPLWGHGRCAIQCLVCPVCLVGLLPQNAWQLEHPALGLRLGAVLAIVFKHAIALRLRHGLVDHCNDGRRIAAGVVAAQAHAAQALHHKGLRRLEHLGLCTAKSVNALLGISHHKHTRRMPGPRIPLQPSAQGLPLQGVGVLKFVYQQMPHPRIQPLLHPAAEHRVRHQHQGGALQIAHVNPAAFALECGIVFHQAAGQACHALLVQPCLVLVLGLLHVLQQRLCGLHHVQPHQLVAEFAGRAFLGE